MGDARLNIELHKQHLILVVMSAVKEEVCVGMRVKSERCARMLPSFVKKDLPFLFDCVQSQFGRGPRSARTRCGVGTQLPCGEWDLSSLSRDRSHVPCVGSWILNP